MGDAEDSSPPASPEKSNQPMLYYGLAVVGAAAIVLVMYNLIIVKWCSSRHNRSNQMNNHNRFMNGSMNQSFENSNANLVSSFKYKKKGSENQEEGEKQTDDYCECAVCLSAFEDGEEVRKLPRCNHCFHAQCIDMWLYSHFDCPLCRTPVERSNCSSAWR